MAKEYLNPVAVAEQGIAEFIAECPAVSGLFDGAAVPVFAATDESAATAIMQKVSRGLKQCIVVAFTGTEEAAAELRRLPTRSTLSVSVLSPGLFAEKAPRATTDLATAIIQSLHGVQFGEPFVPGHALKFKSWTQEKNDGGQITARVEFEAVIFFTNE